MRHPLISLAWKILNTHLEGGKFTPQPPLSAPQACFVSLKAKGRLRGCMGTLTPTKPNLEEEIASNTLSAAFKDPRFDPVEPEELAKIRISIDLLSPLEPVEKSSQLDPARYGVVVTAGNKTGILLPDLPGVNSPQRQIEICREKADISPSGKITLERFTVERIKE